MNIINKCEKLCERLVREEPNQIQTISNPSEYIQNLAVSIKPSSIQHIKGNIYPSVIKKYKKSLI